MTGTPNRSHAGQPRSMADMAVYVAPCADLQVGTARVDLQRCRSRRTLSPNCGNASGKASYSRLQQAGLGQRVVEQRGNASGKASYSRQELRSEAEQFPDRNASGEASYLRQVRLPRQPSLRKPTDASERASYSRRVDEHERVAALATCRCQRKGFVFSTSWVAPTLLRWWPANASAEASCPRREHLGHSGFPSWSSKCQRGGLISATQARNVSSSLSSRSSKCQRKGFVLSTGTARRPVSIRCSRADASERASYFRPVRRGVDDLRVRRADASGKASYLRPGEVHPRRSRFRCLQCQRGGFVSATGALFGRCAREGLVEMPARRLCIRDAKSATAVSTRALEMPAGRLDIPDDEVWSRYYEGEATS